MKHCIRISWLICACIISSFAQDNNPPKIVRQYVEVPRDITLHVIAVQPGCPIKFEKVRRIAGVDGGFGSSYLIRNIGEKPIRSVTVASSDASINTFGVERGVFLKPGQLMTEFVPNCKGCAKEEIIPLTDELREKLNLKGSMRSVVVLMVTNIEYTDGTKYSDETTYIALQDFFDDLGDAIRKQKRQN